jgi:hypothetical protein
MNNKLDWSNDFWFPETKANRFSRKVKISKIFSMDISKVTYTHCSYIGHPYKKVYKIPVGENAKKSSCKDFIKYYLGKWMK